MHKALIFIHKALRHTQKKTLRGIKKHLIINYVQKHLKLYTKHLIKIYILRLFA